MALHYEYLIWTPIIGVILLVLIGLMIIVIILLVIAIRRYRCWSASPKTFVYEGPNYSFEMVSQSQSFLSGLLRQQQSETNGGMNLKMAEYHLTTDRVTTYGAVDVQFNHFNV